eukprot:2668407-Amphidinium_carterae.1
MPRCQAQEAGIKPVRAGRLGDIIVGVDGSPVQGSEPRLKQNGTKKHGSLPALRCRTLLDSSKHWMVKGLVKTSLSLCRGRSRTAQKLISAAILGCSCTSMLWDGVPLAVVRADRPATTPMNADSLEAFEMP